MYPSLPKQDVITEVLRRINDQNFNPSKNKKALIELVIISVEFMSISCNYQYYDHKNRLFTGSPTILAFAELYIQRVEEIHVYRMIHTPCLWLRKIDDTFCITKYDKKKHLINLISSTAKFSLHMKVQQNIKSIRTCRSRSHKNTDKKSKNCFSTEES